MSWNWRTSASGSRGFARGHDGCGWAVVRRPLHAVGPSHASTGSRGSSRWIVPIQPSAHSPRRALSARTVPSLRTPLRQATFQEGQLPTSARQPTVCSPSGPKAASRTSPTARVMIPRPRAPRGQPVADLPLAVRRRRAGPPCRRACAAPSSTVRTAQVGEPARQPSGTIARDEALGVGRGCTGWAPSSTAGCRARRRSPRCGRRRRRWGRTAGACRRTSAARRVPCLRRYRGGRPPLPAAAQGARAGQRAGPVAGQRPARSRTDGRPASGAPQPAAGRGCGVGHFGAVSGPDGFGGAPRAVLSFTTLPGRVDGAGRPVRPAGSTTCPGGGIGRRASLRC